MSLRKIETDFESPKVCPECKSDEGFWLIAKRESTFFQCKHCASILDACKAKPKLEKSNDFKLVVKLHR